MEDRRRCFLAVAIDEKIKEEIGRAAAVLPCALRPVAVESLHVTLRFYGEITSRERAVIEGYLGESLRRDPLSPFFLRLRGRGLFPSRGAPRVLWIGLSPVADGLIELARRGEGAAVAAGLPPERRPFSPHLTLARFREGQKNDGQEILSLLPDRFWGEWAVKSLSLMSSTLRPQGPLYRPLRVFDLKEVAQGGQESSTHA